MLVQNSFGDWCISNADDANVSW